MNAKIKRIGALSAGLIVIGVLVFVTMLSSPVVSDDDGKGICVECNTYDSYMTEVTFSGDAAWVAYRVCLIRCGWDFGCRIRCLVAYRIAVGLCLLLPPGPVQSACLL